MIGPREALRSDQHRPPCFRQMRTFSLPHTILLRFLCCCWPHGFFHEYYYYVVVARRRRRLLAVSLQSVCGRTFVRPLEEKRRLVLLDTVTHCHSLTESTSQAAAAKRNEPAGLASGSGESSERGPTTHNNTQREREREPSCSPGEADGRRRKGCGERSFHLIRIDYADSIPLDSERWVRGREEGGRRALRRC